MSLTDIVLVLIIRSIGEGEEMDLSLQKNEVVKLKPKPIAKAFRDHEDGSSFINDLKITIDTSKFFEDDPPL